MITIEEAWEANEPDAVAARQLMANGRVWYLEGEVIDLKLGAREVARIDVVINPTSGSVLARITETDGRGFKTTFMTFVNTPVTIVW